MDAWYNGETAGLHSSKPIIIAMKLSKKASKALIAILIFIFFLAGVTSLDARLHILPPHGFLAQLLPQVPGAFAQQIISRCTSGKPEVVLSWNTSAKATSYAIYRRPLDGKNGGESRVGEVKATTFVDTAISNETLTYSYTVKAINGFMTTPATPQNVAVKACTMPMDLINSSSPRAVLGWGAYVGWQEGALALFEKRIGKHAAYQATFVHWGNEKSFPAELGPSVRDAGKTLVIFWEAMDYNDSSYNQLNFSYDTILNSSWDSYIRSFAESAADYSGPIILIPFEEMNGNWSPWSVTGNGNSAVKHIAAYRHIHDLFAIAPNVRFAWDVNNDAVPDTAENRFENFYPGDKYVDYVGVNGFNFGDPWQSFQDIFADSLQRLAVYEKPIYIFSMASAEGPDKAAWITNALTQGIPSYPHIQGWIWFNENKERDWRVWSDVNSLQAFQASLP